MVKPQKSLTTRDIAEYCAVTQRTVVQWINEEKLIAYRTPGNHSRVREEDFLTFLNRFNMPIPDELKQAGPEERKKKILIVDDDEEMVSAIKRILIKEPFDIEVAYDGFTAGFRFNDFRPDLVILDVKMPGFDGYQVCENIRQNPVNEDIKILIVSGFINDEGIQKVKGLGADDVLQKPFENDELLVRIKHLFQWTRRSID